MRNDVFSIKFDRKNGTVRALVPSDDPNRMKWTDGPFEWGQPVAPVKGRFSGFNRRNSNFRTAILFHCVKPDLMPEIGR